MTTKRTISPESFICPLYIRGQRVVLFEGPNGDEDPVMAQLPDGREIETDFWDVEDIDEIAESLENEI